MAAPTQPRTYNLRGSVVDLSVVVKGSFAQIAEDVVKAINEPYREVSKQEIADYYPSSAQFTVIADGKAQVGLTDTRLDGSVIDSATAVNPKGQRKAGRIQANSGTGGTITPEQLASVQRAFSALISTLRGATANFAYSDWRYRSGRLKPGSYQRSVTVFQNGARVSAPVWAKFSARSNLAVAPLVSYANPLEVLKRGSLMYAAAKAARAAGGPDVVVNFSYRAGRKLGLGAGSFPVAEIGLRGSTVFDNMTAPGQARRKRRRSRRKG